MAGIYVHVPFCKKACHYCNFHFSTSLKGKNDFTDALLKEIFLQKNYLQLEVVETIYFGGGTPSLLDGVALLKIMETLHLHFTISKTVEVTFETNPDDITAAALLMWKNSGVNRLSIGIQSFFEEDLIWMNRAHNAKQAENCIALTQNAGFTNFSIDLIYGTPTLSDDKWQQNVNKAILLQVPHISCYALTVESGTALQKMIDLQKKENVDTDKQARHFLLLMDWLQQAGYEHYEISNYAIPGFRSRHNASYWDAKKYLGLGPSAHSFNGVKRQWNIANNALYHQSLLNNIIPFEEEVLTVTQQLNEYIMTSLRTIEGLNLQLVEKKFSAGARDILLVNSNKFIASNKLILNIIYLQLTTEGKLFADGIAADLFFSDTDKVRGY